MITYITAFIFYTLAMVGVLIGGFCIYKKMIEPIKNETKGLIKVLDTYSIAPKKSLMVIKVRYEYFLIALDNERTTFLSKLDVENKKPQVLPSEISSKDENYDIEADIQKEIQDMMKKNNRYDDSLKSKNTELQKQFMELYQKDEPEIKMQNDEVSKRKQMIKHLINELNSNKTAGSKF